VRQGSLGKVVDKRLARIEKVVALESARSEELLRKGEELLARVILAGASSRAEGALDLRRDRVVPVDQPLALISQAQRSGGTLLARLFDGHPQCHVHPHELHIGDRRPHVWPELPLDGDPESWFSTLREEKLGYLNERGRREVPLKKQASAADERYVPFSLPPALQRRLFLDEVERRSPIESEREILNCYMTSLFNAWLDNRNLYGSDKRWVVAFSPRRAWGEGLERLFGIYPDGRLISILRDPLGWYASAQRRSQATQPEELLEVWKRSVAQMLDASRRYPERVFIVRFEELVLETEAAMRRLASFLGIYYHPQLAVPTFNRYLTGPNSSFEIRSTGIVAEPVERGANSLSAERRALVGRRCGEQYREALAVLARSAGASD
jgi:hypothetical protein